jgi:hypothetical protein
LILGVLSLAFNNASHAASTSVASATGGLRGTVVRGNGLSAVGARVAIRSPDGAVVDELTTDSSGEFSTTGLTPGTYEVAVVDSGKDAGSTAMVEVEVAAGRDAVATLELQGASAPSAPPPSPVPVAALNNSLIRRLGRAYVADWAGNGPGTAVPQQPRRGYPGPIESPPFPASDWPIGGTPTIGVPDGQTYPLMQAINENKGITKIYGWVEVGANGSTNNKTNAGKGIASNAPSAYDVYANNIQMDQGALYFERYPNTAQTAHFDWGYRITLLYGTDYRFTTAKGMFSQQLLLKNNQYGFDPVMLYYDFYFPKVRQGMNIRVGRYVSLPDIEAQLAPNNYSYSHSILYTYDCYTQTGVVGTVKVSDHLTVQAGISPGCDVMPWTTDAKVTGTFCATYTWSKGGNALNSCANSLNDSKYAYNNLAAYYETWYHRINATWHTDSEGWYQYMKDVPNMYWYNAVDQTNTSTGQYLPSAKTPWPEVTFERPGGVNLNFGAVCEDPRLPAAKQPARCYAPEWAITNYIEHNFWNNTASLNIRSEFVDDIRGQRTGTPAKYEEHMVGFDFWAGSTITFRPELSYTHAFAKYGVTALNIQPGASIANLEGVSQGAAPNPVGLGKTQSLTVSADLIWHF